MHVETELLLTTAQANLERLAADLAARGGTNARELRADYFDTPDFAFGRRGIAIVIRHDDRGATESVQQSAPDPSGLHTTTFLEIDAPGDAPDVAPDVARLRDLLPGDVLPEVDLTALERVFRVEGTLRHAMVAPAPGTHIDVSLARGTLVVGDVEEPISEIHLKLREGARAALFELAQKLERRVPLRIERRTRLERALALARGGRHVPVRMLLARVGPLMTASEAFRTICFGCLAHLNANREGLLADQDPEYVHQMRVALRRLGSAFKVFSPVLPAHALQPPVADIRWLTQALGPLRDCDVFIENCMAPLTSQLQGHRGLRTFERACARRREALQRAAARAVGSRRYQRFVLGLSAWLSSDDWHSLVEPEAARALRLPVTAYARSALTRRHKRVVERGRGLSHLSAAKLHRLRVATKKLRYAATFFAGLYPDRRTGRPLGVLGDLQDALGGMNDCAVAERLIKEMRAASRGAMLDDAEELLSSWNAAALTRHREHLRHTWKTFRVTDRFWDKQDEPDTVAARGGRRHVARHGAQAHGEGQAAGEEDGRLAQRQPAARKTRRRERSPARPRNRARAH